MSVGFEVARESLPETRLKNLLSPIVKVIIVCCSFLLRSVICAKYVRFFYRSQICMALSALYHTFSCRSEHDYNTFLMYDLFGIALSLLAIYASGIYYAFWCHYDYHTGAELIKIPGSEIWSGAEHTLKVSLRCENHTAKQVVAKLRSVVDVREMGVAVDRLRKARNQKVIVSYSTAEDARKIDERLKMRGAKLRVSKPDKKLPIVVIWDVLRMNTDKDIVRSLGTHNRHSGEDLNWEMERAKVCYRRRV
ncbi:hypothetical protein EVAR_88678_1 [Eumeta japonica]|uniref:Uncharacterized protein n=1 Tax=Eumeta variegata TaxID=151549 RepID=A0A4C1Y918_EUMVA|nr:hypothetical protein EVAR_88678_1 [Eumeta japonica]